MTDVQRTFAILLLAAGGSSRLGRPKQLVPWHGTTLVRHLACEALAANPQTVLVITGAWSEEVELELRGLDVRVVHHEGWKEGMGSSISAGMRAVPPEAASAILLASDQPYVTFHHMNRLAEVWRTSGRSIVASRYNSILGPPVLFDRMVFRELADLRGDLGARKIVAAHGAEAVDFPDGAIDVDTPDDLERLRIG